MGRSHHELPRQKEAAAVTGRTVRLRHRQQRHVRPAVRRGLVAPDDSPGFR